MPENYVNRGSITIDGKTTEHYYPVKPKKGLRAGRWIYCKYCHKNVTPTLSSANQICCSECDYGLTPDFVKMESLQLWLDGKEDEALDQDSKDLRALTREDFEKLIAGVKEITSEQKTAQKEKAK